MYVITGTDTEVGKTVVTAAVATLLVRRGARVAVVKAAQTGVGPDEPGDAQEVRRLAGDIDIVEGVRLPDPLAPDTAARLAGVRLPTLDQQRELILAQVHDHDEVVVEGAGGVLVNLGLDFTLLDIACAVRDSGTPVEWLVVARAGLGTLNHTRLTVDAITGRGFDVRGVVIGSWPAEPGLAERHNREDLPRTSGVPLLGAIPAGAGVLPVEQFRSRAADWLTLS